MRERELQNDPAAFRAALLIDSDQGPVPLATVMDDWQRKDFEALDDGWRRAAVGAKVEARYQRAMIERSRGASKTGDEAVMACWCLFASRRQLALVAAAADADQARLIRDACGRLCYLNPWLASILEVRANSVINKHTQSTLEILTSDAPTSYGLLVDGVIVDELTCHKKRDLWDSLFSSAAKKSTAMLVIITNAGVMQSWQWELREAVRTDPAWYFSHLDSGLTPPSWITADRLAEQERLLPSVAYRRLWLNEWVSGGGDALRPEDIDAAFSSGIVPMEGAERDWEVVAGLDAGISRNWTCLALLAINRGQSGFGKMRLAALRKWKPLPGISKVDLADVEREILALHARYNIRQLNLDPWECRYLGQRIQASGYGVGDRFLPKHHTQSVPPGRRKMRVVEVPPTAQNLQRMATAVIETFQDHRIELFEDADLRRDLSRLMVEERANNSFRLVSPTTSDGSHGDCASALQMALAAAADMQDRRKVQLTADGRPPLPEGSTRCDQAIATLNAHRVQAELERLALQRKHAEEGHRGPFIKVMKQFRRL